MNCELNGRSESALAVMRTARGLLCIFWGLPLSLLLFSQALTIRTSFVLPAYLPGVMLICIGVIWLWSAGRMSPSWRALVRQTIMILCLIIYFAPFVSWWEMLPATAYLLSNLWLFFLTVAGLLHLLNRLAGDVAEQTDCQSLALEARFCRRTVFLLMMLPLVLIYLRAAAGALIHGGSLYSEIAQNLIALPSWTLLLFLFPFPMTMANLWRARNQCLGMLDISRRKAE